MRINREYIEVLKNPDREDKNANEKIFDQAHIQTTQARDQEFARECQKKK